MIKNKYVAAICCIVMALAVVFTALFSAFIVNHRITDNTGYNAEYADKLFDTSYVHSIDIRVKDEDWRNMIKKASEEQFVNCDVTIDGTKLVNVALRPKGMTSLSNVEKMGSERFSFKIDFDGFNQGTNYMGLDTLCLNNVIQDNTYMKDYFSYRMMNEAGAKAPLCSYTNITVNGKNFGLYVAVEAVEESFAKRVYGNEHGKLYKPELLPSSEENGNAEVALLYKGDDVNSYPAIWDGAVFDTENADKKRLIQALKDLNEGENLEKCVNVDEVLRYFAVHNFVVNFDSYTGILKHNYYLYEKDGQLSMAAWDYNLSFGGGAMDISIGGSADSEESKIDNSTQQVNYPIDTPVSMTTLEERPMLGRLLENEEYMHRYHNYLSDFVSDYIESGRFDDEYNRVYNMIIQYVGNDPTKFCTMEQFTEAAATLQKFCDLRAQSVRGQLDGVIPATTDGQEDNPYVRIDASMIDVNCMGTMMGDDMPFGGGEGMPEEIDVAMVANVFGLETDALEGKSQEEIVQTLIETLINQGQMGMMGGGMDDMQGMITNVCLYGGLSIILLILGLFCAFKFKKRC